MSCLILMITTLITAKTVVVCNNDLTETSRVFSLTSYGRLPGELLLAVSKNVVGDCLYACMQHFACLTISYHKLSGECQLLADIFRSSHRRCSVKKGVLRNFSKFTGKHLCQSLFCNKVAGLTLQLYKKKRLWHRCFPVNFAKFLRTPFLRTPPDDCFCILYRDKVIPDVKWESYGHFESEIVRYVYCYIISADEYSLAKPRNNKSCTVFLSLTLPSFM